MEEVQGRGRQRRVGEAKGGEGRGDEAQGGAKGGENDGPWHPSRRDGLGSGGSGRPTGWQLTDAAERTTLVKTYLHHPRVVRKIFPGNIAQNLRLSPERLRDRIRKERTCQFAAPPWLPPLRSPTPPAPSPPTYAEAHPSVAAGTCPSGIPQRIDEKASPPDNRRRSAAETPARRHNRLPPARPRAAKRPTENDRESTGDASGGGPPRQPPRGEGGEEGMSRVATSLRPAQT